MGPAQERSFGAQLAGPAGEEGSCFEIAPFIQTLFIDGHHAESNETILSPRDFLAINPTVFESKLPASLLRMGRCFVFEPSSGIKANLLRTVSNISSARMEKVITSASITRLTRSGADGYGLSRRFRDGGAVSTFWSLGSTRLCKNDCAMRRWVGPRNTSSTNPTSSVLWTPWTLGSI